MPGSCRVSEPRDQLPGEEPARREFRLKPREFAVENRPVAEPSAHEPTDVREHFAVAGTQRSRVPPSPIQPNEVHALLRDNLARADAAGQIELKPAPRRRSRRLRDHLVIALASTLLAIIANALTQATLVVFALWVFLNVGLAWIMWFVMDDY